MTVTELLDRAYRAANVFSFAENATAEQGDAGLLVLNSLLLELASDNLIPNAIQVSTVDEEVILPAAVLANVHYLLAVKLATESGVTVSPELAANASLADAFITRQSMNPKTVTGGLPREDSIAITTPLSQL